MESSESQASIEETLQRLGYPLRIDRNDLWIKPRAALGVSIPESDRIQVVYWAGFPRAVVACDVHPSVVLAYAAGPAFSHPPTVALVFDGSGSTAVFKRNENEL